MSIASCAITRRSAAAPIRPTTSRFSSCATALQLPLLRRTPTPPCRLRPHTPPQPLVLLRRPQMPHLLLRRRSTPVPPLRQGLSTRNRDALVAILFPDGSAIQKAMGRSRNGCGFQIKQGGCLHRPRPVSTSCKFFSPRPSPKNLFDRV